MKLLQINDYLYGGGAEVVFRYTTHLLKAVDIDTQWFYGSEHPKTSLGYIYSFKAKRALEQRVREFLPDIVHLHNYYHLLSPSILHALQSLKQEFGFKIVMTVHDYHLLCANNGCIRWKGSRPTNCTQCQGKKFYKVLLKNCDHRGFVHSSLKFIQHTIAYTLLDLKSVIDLFICPSHFLKEKMKIAIDEKRLTVLHNPAFALSCNVDEIAISSKVINKKYDSIFLGRLSPEKGIDRFLANDYSFSKFGSFGIIGDGPKKYTQKLQKMIKQKKLAHVDLLGPMDHLEALSYLNNSQRLIFPSLWFENCPLTLLEAIFLGKEIFHYGIGASEEIAQLKKEHITEETYINQLLKIYDTVLEKPKIKIYETL
jgi:glycosyltransferase involved in cell wall biosynthesis